MASLTGASIASSYTSLLKLNGNTDTLVAGASGDAIQVVDGNGDASPLYLNTDRLGIGGQPTTELHILSSTGDRPILTIENTNADNSPPSIHLYKNSSGVANNDQMGDISWFANDDGGTKTRSAMIRAIQTDVSASSDDSKLSIYTQKSGTETETMTISSGNVGIGVVPEATNSLFTSLQIGGNANISTLKAQGASGEVDFGHNYYFSAAGTDKYISEDEATQFRQSAGNFIFRTAPSDSAGATITFTQVAKFDINSRISLSNNDGNTDNTVFGYNAFTNNGTVLGDINADRNTVFGNKAMGTGTTTGGYNNVAIGSTALEDHTSADSCVAIGSASLNNVTSGIRNLGIGTEAGTIVTTGADNIAIGTSANLTSSSASNQTVIGVSATAQGDNSVTLGNASVTDVYMSQDSGAYVHSQNVPNHVANTMSSPYYRFDGTNDQIDIADNAALDLSASISIECVFKTESLTVFQELVNKADSTSGVSTPYRLNITDGGLLHAYVSDGSSANTAVTSSQLTTGQWYHGVFTVDGSNLKLYLNGALVDTESQTVTPETQNGILTIGRWGDTGGEYYPFLGEMQKVRLYNKALTATEVKEMYSGASVPFKYKGANQTNLLTGGDADFGSTAGGWTNATLGGGYNETGDITTTATSAGQYFANNVLSKTVGKRYRLTFDVSSLVSTWTIQEHDDGDSAGSIGTVSANGTQSFEFTSKFALGFRFVAGANDSSANFDNFSVVPIGAVAEYDGSGIASDKWFDKSGNDLHGTVSGSTVENAPSGDDGLVYEEGTWTPAFRGAGGSAGSLDATGSGGSYTRIGRQVHIRGRVDVVNVGSYSGNIQIGGIPFTAGGSASDFHGTARLAHVTLAGHTVISRLPSGGNTIDFTEIISGGQITNPQVSEAQAGGNTAIIVEMTYFTD